MAWACLLLGRLAARQDLDLVRLILPIHPSLIAYAVNAATLCRSSLSIYMLAMGADDLFAHMECFGYLRGCFFNVRSV